MEIRGKTFNMVKCRTRNDLIMEIKIQDKPPVKQPPNRPKKPPVKEPQDPPQPPPPPDEPPVKEPPDEPEDPPVKEPLFCMTDQAGKRHVSTPGGPLRPENDSPGNTLDILSNRKEPICCEGIRKSVVTGLGAVLLMKDKIEEITRRWVEEGRMRREDADRLVDELYAAGQHQWSSVENSVKDAVRRMLSSMDVGSRQEIETLKTEIGNLQKRVEMLEDTRDTAESQ